MEWKVVHGTQEAAPPEVEFCGNMVFVRRNIARKTYTDDQGTVIEMWEYEEAYTDRLTFAAWMSAENNTKIEAITPYTESKLAYIGDTSTTFMTDREGNLTVYFPYEYTVERLSDRITVSYAELEEVTKITISII